MSIRDYSSADGLLIINGTNITDWGQTQPALSIEDINPRVQMQYGLGGGAAAMDPATQRKRVTINLLTGSDQARYLVALAKAKTTIQGSWTQLGSVEAEVFIDGRIVSRGPRGRIVENTGSLSDEQFVIEFRDSTEI